MGDFFAKAILPRGVAHIVNDTAEAGVQLLDRRNIVIGYDPGVLAHIGGDEAGKLRVIICFIIVVI